MSRKICTAGLAVVMFQATVVTAADVEGRFAVAGLEESAVHAFLTELQAAVRAGNASKLADLVSYPLPVNTGGHADAIRTKAQFVKRYSDIIDSVTAKAILNQRFEDLFSNWQGVMIGSGNVWLSGICENESPRGTCKGQRVLIVAVNRSPK
jgi:hypothetical protein